ncbi:hypothetical protein FJQ98_20840 [Lysinibacillus agricola]|uniref:Uncharacterized protein n=1 Tax=Lysinibacillus agricola TaxID=2590012 RepID=A0ABX7AQP8_9BACI|nr:MULTISPECIES: YugN family protein [Lysinibacillus]QQP11612.1 hypothetical protein FJQ98_20840 [Lysinibacillus agricola]
MVGKEIGFGYLRDKIESRGFTIGGNWEYQKRKFRFGVMERRQRNDLFTSTLIVTEGELDFYDAQIRVQKPFVIKDVTNVGLDYDEGSLLDATGASQFQAPLDKDGYIHDKSKWVSFGEQVVRKKVLPFFY